jgi:hypothetical protein
MSASTQEQPRKAFGVRGGLSSGSWKPGQSGNPNGRAKPLVDVAALARKHGPKAIEIVAGIMMRDKDSKVRLAAAVALLDRGFGRPKQEIETTGNQTIELHLVAARVISQELLASADAPPVIEHAAVTGDALDVPTE